MTEKINDLLLAFNCVIGPRIETVDTSVLEICHCAKLLKYEVEMFHVWSWFSGI